MAAIAVKIVDFDESIVTQTVKGESLELDLTVEELEERLEFAEGGGGGGGGGSSCSCGLACGCISVG